MANVARLASLSINAVFHSEAKTFIRGYMFLLRDIYPCDTFGEKIEVWRAMQPQDMVLAFDVLNPKLYVVSVVSVMIHKLGTSILQRVFMVICPDDCTYHHMKIPYNHMTCFDENREVRELNHKVWWSHWTFQPLNCCVWIDFWNLCLKKYGSTNYFRPN